MTSISLIDLACRSALRRIDQRFSSHLGKSDLLNSVVGAIGADMRQLAHQCRAADIDARTSPLWPLLECKDEYEDVFERNRPVDAHRLTPMIIYQCLERGNQLRHEGWKVIVGGSREVTDDYGQPAWEPRVWVETPSGELLQYSGVSRELARRIYARIAGREFAGVDTLGHDSPHCAEGISYGDALDYLEEKGTLLTCSTETGPLWDAFAKLSVEDPQACLAMFDSKGRHFDRRTGFWASLRSERYDSESGEWYRRFDVGAAPETNAGEHVDEPMPRISLEDQSAAAARLAIDKAMTK